MDEEGKESREEDAAPLSSGFVTESHGRNRAQNGAVPSGPPLDSVPSIPAKEPNSRADWRIPLEQVEAILQPSLSAAETKVTLVMRQFVESIESQILSALKQAAMEIIEHLGKEAAMRVLVAERKAALFEQELINTKQEALAMLLRLKHSMDAQIIQAERACVIERKQIQEMEAKLLTSQDTVKTLKAELKRKGEVLEKMKKVMCPLDDNRLDLMRSSSEYSTMQVTSSAKQSPECMLTGKPSLPSVIMKCKEQHILANGDNKERYRETANESAADVLLLSEGNENKECMSTENDLRSRSVEERQMASTVCFKGQTDIPVTTVASLMQDYCPHAREEHVSIAMAYPCAKFENTNVNVDFEDMNSVQKENAGCLSQSTIFITSTGKSCTLDGGSVHLDRKASPTSESDASLGVESKLAMTDTGAIAVRNAEKKKDCVSCPDVYSAAFLPQDREASAREAESSQTSGGDEKAASSTRENLGMKVENKDANSCGLDTNKHVDEKGNPEVDFSTSSKFLDKDGVSVRSTLYSSPMNSSQENIGISLETTDNRNDCDGAALTGIVQSDGNKARLSVGLDLTGEECERAILASMPSATKGLKNIHGEMTDISVGQGPETNVKAPEQQAHSRLTRFTFQRKRRREGPFQQNGNLVQEEKDPKKGETKQHEHFAGSLSGKSPQKHRMVLLASQKSSLVAESSRDSRRLMQGARQLISLSEKKSW